MWLIAYTKRVINRLIVSRLINKLKRERDTIVGNIDCPKKVLERIGYHVVLGRECHIYKDSVVIGDGTYISGGRVFFAEIGKYCSIGYDVCLGAGEHRIDSATTYPIYAKTKTAGIDFPEQKKVVIGNACWIGNSVIIRQGVIIGDGSIIGSGAVVTHDVPPYSVFVGVPAHKIRDVIPSNSIEIMEKMKWWDWPREQIIKAAQCHAFESIQSLLLFYENHKQDITKMRD